ncbi:MAG TPA: 2-isopropylmalate synthase [Thermodesulfovibrio thiophilus]|nr:2-isopropylmalate synthase [Thermodesulfovibrio thiophilus]HQA04161.1 2-isopropylmalate synthase [Thermodesulfovibrio thiophilus]HQD36240.1 2-isopropylmalate synthase [Thermodesulfovibrio thiophilus]
MKRIKIFDTTLRDGEQSPGASMNVDEKIQVAKQLKKLGVDIVEAGFPIASPGDFEAVNRISREVKGIVVAGLCRTRDQDIERAAEALKPAEQKRIHTFIATSDIHLKYKLRMDKQQVIEASVRAVKKARQYTDDVEFSAEDATRTDWDYLCKITEEVIKAGATTVNIPDTVGYTVPQEYAELIEYLINKVPNIDKAIISVHCHNDLGLAVANSLTAILKGAGQVECTINGIGERAGNAALEEIVMALKVRNDFFKTDTNIVTQEIYRTSRLISKITGMVIQPNKAIVGANAFAHEAGIHQDGVLKERTTYEIMKPEDIGIPSSKIVLGKHSGRHAFKKRLEELGFSLTDEEINRAFERFKKLADQKKYIFNEDLEALVSDEFLRTAEVYQLANLEISGGMNKKPTATVKIKINDMEKEITVSGDGPVDSVYKAITELTNSKAELKKFEIKAITGGTDALGEVTVILEEAGHTVRGHGSDTDIIVASAKAYINALNKLALKNLKA